MIMVYIEYARAVMPQLLKLLLLAQVIQDVMEYCQALSFLPTPQNPISGSVSETEGARQLVHDQTVNGNELPEPTYPR